MFYVLLKNWVHMPSHKFKIQTKQLGYFWAGTLIFLDRDPNFFVDFDFLAAIAALYGTMSVGLSVCRSVGLFTTSFVMNAM